MLETLHFKLVQQGCRLSACVVFWAKWPGATRLPIGLCGVLGKVTRCNEVAYRTVWCLGPSAPVQQGCCLSDCVVSWAEWPGATRLPPIGLCGILGQVPRCNKVAIYRTVWYLGPSDPVPWRTNWWLQISNVAEVRETLLRSLCWQSPELYAESMHSLIPHCDQCLNLQDGQVVKLDIFSVFSWEKLFLIN